MQERVSAKLITYEGGFRGDYLAGLSEVYMLLTKEFAETDVIPAPDTYNLLGASVYDSQIQSDMQKLEHLIDKAFGARCLMILGLSDSVECLKYLGQAAINIVISEEALPAAKWLKENCNADFIYPINCGGLGSPDWLAAVGKALV